MNVKTLKIGQSAGKIPKFDKKMTRIWYSLNDRTGMGLRILVKFNDSLRYSLVVREIVRGGRFLPINNVLYFPVNNLKTAVRYRIITYKKKVLFI